MMVPKTALTTLALTLAAAGLPSGTARAGEDDTFFETKIRPVLAERCWSCHGPEKQTNDLRLDSRAAALEGGFEGPSIVPGEPDESLLIAAVRQDGDLKMPPKGKLDDAAVADLVEWVRRGAPWPEGSPAAESKEDRARVHWAFQPVRKPPVPRVADPGRVATPIDAFVVDRLARAGLTPSPEADRRTLIRRLSFDLIGLPPTPEEVAAFAADTSPDAYERLVERLLDSPRYGERWGRHWLDVARYADTKGYVFTQESRYPFAYTYRDYVIQAFNADKPYDRFIKEQVAADLLPDRDPTSLAALGFLTVGRRFLNVQEDIMDDRIDVVTRGLMGLTVACARCHDHKYDPIPTEDYYSLYGVFNNSIEPEELPLLGDPDGAEAEDYRRAKAQKQKALDDFNGERRAFYEKEFRTRAEPFLVASLELGFNPRHEKLDERARADDLSPQALRFQIGRWKAALDASRESPEGFLAAWHAFAALPEGEFAAGAPEIAERLAGSAASGGGAASPLAWLVEPRPASMVEVAHRYGALLARAADPATPADPAIDEARRFLESPDGPFFVPPEQLRRVYNRADRDRLAGLKRELDAVDVTHPGAPSRAMVVNDRPEPVPQRVHVRGNIGRQGEEVPRRFLKVLSGPDRRPFEHGSGRLELAEAIASPDNPLTARVLVNRVWLGHFGAPLVATPSDFGLRSDPPSHPELLDYLAARFVEGGWSIKDLHRLIVLSRTYRQQSLPRPEGLAADPENRLLWRQNRQRLDFEATRDALLAVAGRLDDRIGGRSVPIADDPSATRRTVYAYVDRQFLSTLYRTFDFPSPDSSSPARPETTVPQQGLFFLNSPFVAAQARHLAGRLGDGDVPDRVGRLYQVAFGRGPSPEEVELARRFLAASAGRPAERDALDPWAAYAQVLLMSNEFLYLD
jgi:hypothetical protein